MSQILLVEDNLSQQTMIAELLKNHGLVVTVVDDGVQAIEEIHKAKPDLVILDIVMPKMNGYEVCRRIKNDQKTKEIPVIMCSSKGEDFDRLWGLKNGADAYVVKPFQPMELIGTIKQLLRR
jgi:twitching motility two-component system response regulator PilH